MALAVPLLIHLLGAGRGVRRRWSSVQLLQEAVLAAGTRLAPSQPWLLLLRCLLLAALTLALAEPTLDRRAVPAALWLVEPGQEAAAPRAGGATVRVLAPGLPVLAAPRRPAGAPVVPPTAPDLWSLLAEADASFPGGTTFHVVARPRLQALRGFRPRLAHPVVWHVPGAVSVVSAPAAKAADALLTLSRGRTLHLRLTATPARMSDAATLREALPRAAGDLGWRLEEDPAPDLAASITGDPTLLVSLGQEAASAWTAAVEHGAVLLRDAPAGGVASPTHRPPASRSPLVPTNQEAPTDGPDTAAGERAAPSHPDEPARTGESNHSSGSAPTACRSLVSTPCCGLFERTLCGPEPNGQAVWRDGAGHPVLTRTSLGQGTVWRYAGRFSAAATAASNLPGIASRPALAAFLRQAFGPPAPALDPNLETTVSQALPQRGPAASNRLAQSLAEPLWLLVALLLLAERWLAGRSAGPRRTA